MGIDTQQAPLGLLIWIALVVVLLWAATPFVFFLMPSWEIRGQFGDMFGALNTLFSGLAFSGLIFTVHLQRLELALQRRELELTRTELKRSAAAQEASEKALTDQAFALHTAARLNALSSIIQHYPIKINRIGGASARSDAEKRQADYIEELERLLRRLPQE